MITSSLTQSVVDLPMHSYPNERYLSSLSISLDEKKHDSPNIFTKSHLMWKKDNCLDIENTLSSQESVTDLRKAQFAVQGMTCGACTSAIRAALEPLEGVISVQVHLISNQAVVIYQPTDIDHPRIRDAIEDSGYDATLWEDAKLKPQAQLEADLRSVEIEIHGFDKLVFVPNLVCRYSDKDDRSPSSINDRLGKLGLLSFSPITMANKVSNITYRPSKDLTIRHILDFPVPVTAFIRKRPSIQALARKNQRREAKELSYLLLLSFLVAIPTFIIGVVGMTLLPQSNPFRIWCEEFVWGGCQRAVLALFVLSTLSQLAVNQYFVVKAWKTMRTYLKSWRWSRLFSFGSMDLLVALSTTIAYLASLGLFIRDILDSPEETIRHGSSTFFDSNVFLGLFILAGRVLEHYARSKTTDAISKLEDSSPDHALLLSIIESDVVCNLDHLLSSPAKKIPADLIEIGDILLLPAGSSPSADGVVVGGSSAFDESSLTGESLPITKVAGDLVLTGTKNISSPIVYRVDTVGQETMMRKIVRAVAEGQTKRSPIQLLAEKITSVFVPLIIYVSLIVLAAWLSVCLSVSESSWVFPAGKTATSDRIFIAFQFSISVLVIACPCGIGLAAPTAQAVGSGLLAESGILAQGGGESFQLASHVDVVVFDKTGTLTKGEASVVHTYLAQDNEGWLWEAIRMSEAISTHPLAQAIVSYCQGKQSTSENELAKMIDCEEIPGRGVRSTFSFEDRTIRLSIGSQEFVCQEHTDFELPIHLQDTVNSWRNLGNTVVFVMKHDSIIPSVPVLFGIADQVRTGFRDVISDLRGSGKDVYMLTGDNPQTALAVAREVGLEESEVKARVLPLEKAEFILKLKQGRRINSLLGCNRPTSRPTIVAFVGDGLNDSAALAAADVGIALSHGSDLSIASASFVVLSNSSIPRAIKQLFKISFEVYRRQILNFGWAMLYNVALIPVAAGVLYPYRHTQLSPIWSAFAMALSSVSVVVSSLALKWGI